MMLRRRPLYRWRGREATAMLPTFAKVGRQLLATSRWSVRPSALPSPRRHCRNGPILLRVFLFHPFLSVVRRDDVAGQGPFGIVTKRWVLGADGMMGKGKGQVRGGRRRGHDSTKAMGGRPTDTRSGGVDRPRAHRRSMTPTSLLATRPFGTATPPLTQLLVARRSGVTSLD